MKRGDVLYFPDWEFRDRGHADKLLVVMNTPGPADTENSKVVMLITTSQDKGRRKKDRGCQPCGGNSSSLNHLTGIKIRGFPSEEKSKFGLYIRYKAPSKTKNVG